jgi:hypothetical protein
MKISIIIIAFCTLTSIKGSAQTTDTFYNAIYALDFDYFIAHRNVGAFINALPTGYTTLKLVGNVDNAKVSFLSVIYPGGSQVLVRVKKYLFMNPIDPNRVWDLALYKKESIRLIMLTHPEYDNKDAIGN